MGASGLVRSRRRGTSRSGCRYARHRRIAAGICEAPDPDYRPSPSPPPSAESRGRSVRNGGLLSQALGGVHGSVGEFRITRLRVLPLQCGLLGGLTLPNPRSIAKGKGLHCEHGR
jgi:hypothetical protein